MNRKQFESYILENYPAATDFPWKIYPNYQVFRHAKNRKWFAVVMDVPRTVLGLEGDERINIVNLKCPSLLSGSLRMNAGFFPAYHMSKEHWISIALNDSASDEDLKMVLDMSFQATAPKAK